MDTIPTIYNSDDTYDALTEILAQEQDNYQLAMARIPGLFGESQKATWLMYRSIGLAEDQVAELMQIRPSIAAHWRRTDEHFLKFETLHLRKLQKEYSADMVRLGFLQNLTLLVAYDTRLMRKAWKDVEKLTSREFETFARIRSTYNPTQLLQLEKTINPNAHPDGVIHVTWSSPERDIPLELSAPEAIEGEVVGD